MRRIGRWRYAIPLGELEYLGSDGIARDETKLEFYWHDKTDRLIVHKWGECYRAHPVEILADLKATSLRMRQYAAQQADYGNWAPTERMNAREAAAKAIEAKYKLAPFQEAQ